MWLYLSILTGYNLSHDSILSLKGLKKFESKVEVFISKYLFQMHVLEILKIEHDNSLLEKQKYSTLEELIFLKGEWGGSIKGS